MYLRVKYKLYAVECNGKACKRKFYKRLDRMPELPGGWTLGPPAKKVFAPPWVENSNAHRDSVPPTLDDRQRAIAL